LQRVNVATRTELNDNANSNVAVRVAYIHLPDCLHTGLSKHLYTSKCMYVCPFAHLTIYSSIYRPFRHPSLLLSVHPPTYLSIYLPLFTCFFSCFSYISSFVFLPIFSYYCLCPSFTFPYFFLSPFVCFFFSHHSFFLSIFICFFSFPSIYME